MRGRVLKPFPYSTDGIHATALDIGDERDFADAMAPGLVREGWIAEVKPEPVAVPVAVRAPFAAVSELPTDQPAPVPAHSKRGRR